MPKTQLPDDDASKGNAVVPELNDENMPAAEEPAPLGQGKDDLMQDEEDTDGNV